MVKPGITKLEQLECLHSEDTPCRPMIIPLVQIGFHVRRIQSKSYNFKEFDKMSIFHISTKTLHKTLLLKLLDKTYIYEMDPASIVEYTERTRFCPQTDRRTDGRSNKVKSLYPPFNFVEAGGIMMAF